MVQPIAFNSSEHWPLTLRPDKLGVQRNHPGSLLSAFSMPANAAATSSIRAAAGLIAVMFTLLLVILGLAIAKEERDARKRAEDRVISAAQVVSTNARWIRELSHQALGRIDAALGPDINSGASPELIREAIEALPGESRAYVANADGRFLYSTDPNIRQVEIRDRPYFKALAAGDRFYTSPVLIRRLDGKQVFVVGKRLERSGRFAGIAFLAFDTSLLKEIWESLQIDHVSTVSLIRSDGQLVARYPPTNGPLDMSNYVLFTEYLKQSDIGAYPAHSPADGATRIVGYRRVPGTDFVAIASIGTEAAYAVFWRNATTILVFALPTAIALAGAILWIVRLLRRDLQQRTQLLEALDLNRMLVKDTHHRVKNNLQAIMSMVRMHDLPARVKGDLQTRISAMAAVHEHLYRLDQVSEINAADLIPGVVEPLRRSFDSSLAVSYDLDLLVLDRDHATPLALLVSEVVTNALKYAHAPGEPGRVDISLKRSGRDEISLSVSDDGPGFDPSNPKKGLGTRLIRAMLSQLNGTFSYSFDRGTRFEASLKFQSGQDGGPIASAQAFRRASKEAAA